MRFSYCMLPDYPLDDSIEMIKTADRLGFHAVYAVDETWHKDLWVLFAAAADKTEHIRFGPNVTHVFLREPTLICQQLATLDELTNGRMECVVSTGNFGLMAQYHVDWEHRKPLSRLKEAMHVMRTFLADGKIDFQGDFFQYTGLFTAARPVQERIPLLMGGMKGPRSFVAAGELADGLHHALSYSREAYEYVVDNVRTGADRAGRSMDDIDVGAWVVTVVGEDSAAAKRAARILVAFYISSMPAEQLGRHGISLEEVQPVVDALGAGDVARAIQLFRPELAEKLSLAGTPEEVVEKIRRDIEPAGVDHMILALSDAHLVKFFAGEDVPGVPTINEQLKLVADRVMPAFGAAVMA
ncbi:LLM class flavin-dependent oxidoreductase [Capillimicrobium parvum]|uniref:Coenzyme F420-dependent oxidoreductase n=1 Tax=Capillimicrobium parvum TaxID=2884022 RepID=A0A9E6XU37_9ACTN|nr:LLM class flavin-dependent oxidoreductase [Capillimicrobium parvum]UGS34458.1 Putative coenzyme F420-dependent oxidoreductase [Capillimicrobium parvum]